MNPSGAIVVGIDGSEASSRALRWALEEARCRNLPVRAVMVWESHAVLSGPAPMLLRPELAPHRIKRQHQQELARIVGEALAGAQEPDVVTELAEGRTADVLEGHSEGAALLVLGDRGHRHLTNALGSTAMRCAHKARCPVVIVPSGMEQEKPTPEQDAPPQTTDPMLR
jgi:nucleotide-binding universal stress UspA family protein